MRSGIPIHSIGRAKRRTTTLLLIQSKVVMVGANTRYALIRVGSGDQGRRSICMVIERTPGDSVF